MTKDPLTTQSCLGRRMRLRAQTIERMRKKDAVSTFALPIVVGDYGYHIYTVDDDEPI